MPKQLVEAQKRQIAAGIALGAKHQAIAQQVGVCLSTVDHCWQDPETVSYIRQFQKKAANQLARIFQKSVSAIEKDIDSRVPDLRIKAREHALKFITAGDKGASGDESGADAGGRTTYSIGQLVQIIEGRRDG